MACGCSSTCDKCTPYVVQNRGPQGPAGPAPNITIGITVLPAGSDPEVTPSGVSPYLHYQLGIPAQALPLFSVVANTLAAGAPATASIDNTNPLAPVLTLGIPRGEDGDDGVSLFTSMTASFVQPAPGGLVTVALGTSAPFVTNRWVHIQGGGHYIVNSNPLNPTQVIIKNPGAADLLPYWGSTATSIPTNAATGATISASGASNQVAVCGIPGLIGIQGIAGVGVTPTTGVGVPSDPPALASQTVTLRYDSLSAPTWVRFYVWNGASWDAGPNMMGPRGSISFFGTADPNVTPPTGSTASDIYFRQTGGVLQIYRNIGSNVWDLEIAYSLAGVTTQASVHDTPGVFAIDTAIFSHVITADKPIELDYDDSNYSGQGEWVVVIRNIDGGSIAVTYAAGQWERDPAVTLPSTLATTATLVLRFVRNEISGNYVFTSAFLPAAV
jgi:hypothetical protein